MKSASLVSVLAIVCTAVVAAPQEAEQALEDIGKIPNGEKYALECLLQTGVKLDSLKSLQTGNIGDDKIKCLVKCFFEKTGFMDAEGNLQRDQIVAQLNQILPKDQVDALVKECDIKGTDACDTAYKATQCYFKNKA